MQSVKVFLDTVRIYGQPQTVASYGFWLVKFHEFVKKPVQEVTVSDIANWVDALKLKYAPMSIALAIAVVKEYVRDTNPTINVRRIKQPKAHSLHPSDPLTPEEYISMLSFIDATTETGVRDNLIIRLLYDTGARIGEMVQMFKNEKSIKDGYAIIDTEKTSEKRFIVWGKDTEVFLRTWLSFNNDFPSLRQCERIVNKYATLAKITEYKKITPHSFRHTKAHLILDNGGTVKDISEVLGHKSPVSSFHYLQENGQEKLVRQRRWV